MDHKIVVWTIYFAFRYKIISFFLYYWFMSPKYSWILLKIGLHYFFIEWNKLAFRRSEIQNYIYFFFSHPNMYIKSNGKWKVWAHGNRRHIEWKVWWHNIRILGFKLQWTDSRIIQRREKTGKPKRVFRRNHKLHKITRELILLQNLIPPSVIHKARMLPSRWSSIVNATTVAWSPSNRQKPVMYHNRYKSAGLSTHA